MVNTQKTVSRELALQTTVLVGGRDFGRCSLAARLPAALWPVGDKPVLRRLLDHLADEGIAEATVCCDKDIGASVEAVCADSRLKTTVVIGELTGGTAGCLRDAVASEPGDLLLAFSGSMMVPPPIAGLIEAHRTSGAELSVVFNPAEGRGSSLGPSAEVYLCQPGVLRYVPSGGYSDIKEGLIPSILRAGGKVCPIVLDCGVGNFRDRRGYLGGLETFFRSGVSSDRGYTVCECSGDRPIFKGTDVSVHPTARICGPVALADHARIMEGAVIMGPAVIGCHATLGPHSAMIRSALWAGAEVGAHCEIRESIVGCGVTIPDETGIVEQALSADLPSGGLGRWQMQRVQDAGREGECVRPYPGRWAGGLRAWALRCSKRPEYLFGGGIVLLAFLWSYWPTFADLVRVWLKSDEYSSGLLVPPLAAYVVWSRRRDILSVGLRPAVFWGITIFLAAQTIRGAGLYFMFQSAERLSLILSIAALILLLMGWKCLRKLATTLLFLSLMLPWPNRVQTAVTLPLQRWATTSAVFCLELVGYEIVRDGNIIRIGDDSVAVAEACNGLRMITAFFVISGLVVLLARRTWWEKLIVLSSSLPIALLCNTLRLATTTVSFTMLEGEIWEQRFHDWGGYAMMPLALAMVVGEFWLIARLTTSPTKTEPAIISRRQAQHVPDS